MNESRRDASAVSLEPAVFRLGRDQSEDVLLGSRCRECGRTFFPPRFRCAACAEATTETVELPRQGTLAARTVLHRRPEFSLIEAPYVLAEVILQEGLHVYGVLMAAEGDAPSSGDRVRLASLHLKDDDSGRQVFGYAFAPADLTR